MYGRKGDWSEGERFLFHLYKKNIIIFIWVFALLRSVLLYTFFEKHPPATDPFLLFVCTQRELNIEITSSVFAMLLRDMVKFVGTLFLISSLCVILLIVGSFPNLLFVLKY